jgi:uncharacterized protein YgbK (DUF1537 family)
MDASLEKLKARIKQLQTQQTQREEKYINAVAHLVKERIQKGCDLSLLTGMILNADQIIKASPTHKEAWQTAGQKFLLRAKNRNFKTGRMPSTA